MFHRIHPNGFTTIEVSLEHFVRKFRPSFYPTWDDLLATLAADKRESTRVEDLSQELLTQSRFNVPIVVSHRPVVRKGKVLDGLHRSAAHIVSGVGPVKLRVGHLACFETFTTTIVHVLVGGVADVDKVFDVLMSQSFRLDEKTWVQVESVYTTVTESGLAAELMIDSTTKIDLDVLKGVLERRMWSDGLPARVTYATTN